MTVFWCSFSIIVKNTLPSHISPFCPQQISTLFVLKSTPAVNSLPAGQHKLFFISWSKYNSLSLLLRHPRRVLQPCVRLPAHAAKLRFREQAAEQIREAWVVMNRIITDLSVRVNAKWIRSGSGVGEGEQHLWNCNRVDSFQVHYKTWIIHVVQMWILYWLMGVKLNGLTSAAVSLFYLWAPVFKWLLLNYPLLIFLSLEASVAYNQPQCAKSQEAQHTLHKCGRRKKASLWLSSELSEVWLGSCEVIGRDLAADWLTDWLLFDWRICVCRLLGAHQTQGAFRAGCTNPCVSANGKIACYSFTNVVKLHRVSGFPPHMLAHSSYFRIYFTDSKF